jgi:hypothetical protein
MLGLAYYVIYVSMRRMMQGENKAYMIFHYSYIVSNSYDLFIILNIFRRIFYAAGYL